MLIPSMESMLLEAEGFALIPGVLGTEECESIGACVAPTAAGSGGTRSLLSQPWCASLVDRLRAHPAFFGLIRPGFVAAQCTYFEKSASRNWLVPVHQDLSIPVAERVANPLLGGWSAKEGALFVQPPSEVLEQLLAVRVHLDPCGAQDGPLRVVPRTHIRGRIDAEVAAAMRATSVEVPCHAERGDALVMRPLLLHTSSKASGTGRRRVLHFLFGPRELPHGLRWQQAI